MSGGDRAGATSEEGMLTAEWCEGQQVCRHISPPLETLFILSPVGRFELLVGPKSGDEIPSTVPRVRNVVVRGWDTVRRGFWTGYPKIWTGPE